MMKLRHYIKNYYKIREFFLYGLLSLAVGAIPAAAIAVRAELIDAATGGASAFFALLALFCGMYLLLAVLKALSLRLSERHGITQAAKLDRVRIEKAARTAFPVTESERFHALLQRASKAPDADKTLYRAIGDEIRLSATLLLSVSAIFLTDPLTAAGIALLLIAGALQSRILAKTTEGFWSKYIENMRRADYFSALLLHREYAAERKIFAFDGAMERRFDSAFAEAKKENARAGRKRLAAELSMQIAFALYVVAVVLLLLRLVPQGKITLGAFASTFYAAVALLSDSRQLYASIFSRAESEKQLSGFFAFLDLPEERAVLSHGEKFSCIECEDVTFTYPGAREPVLKHVSFRLEAGRHYALVGENGCGKSTLVKLILGLYTPDSGTIAVDGQAVSALSSEGRRALFSAVFQDFYPYPLTIRENVSLCAPKALADEEIDDLFDRLDFRPSEREGSYDKELTPLRREGTGLSGGEWQKLAIARCSHKMHVRQSHTFQPTYHHMP